MKYNFSNDNYKNFSKYAENTLVPRSYFIPFSSLEALNSTDIRNERYSSDRVECLSGEWDFAYYDNCKDLPNDFDTDTVKFDKVQLPSTWQHTGYEKPYYLNSRYPFKPHPPYIPEDCSAGVYRRFIEIDDVGLSYTISFLGVAGSLELYCNGKYVGYSEGSHNTACFELNEYIVKGVNEIVVLNHKWCNGTYLECQDMFRCNGIFRDVLLYKSGNNSIYDFEVKASCINDSEDSRYSLKIIPSLKLTDDCALTAFLYDDEELVASCSVNQSPSELQIVDLGTLSVKQWSAECPYLYDLVLVLSKGEETIEVIRRPIGFKNIEICKNRFLFNGKPIKLLGVNHHDTNSKTGYVLTIEEMERDVSIVKQYNANCIRTSHYPPDPAFLDLCDEYGIYVVDEADIETHGCETELHRPGACSQNADWQGHYWDRVYRMYQRDKNHPCITMWSLGNESHGYKNQDYCYNELKRLTSIPIHYEGVCRTRRWSYDVLSQMYTFPNICERIARGTGLPAKYYKKPFYLCEYAHAMGVGAGDLERYVKCFYSSDIMLGGCIWEFVDHAIYHSEGKYEYTYGGDHGEEKHDSNFCVDGLFYPDRTPHSGALQMKACYRPLRARCLTDKKYSFFNHRYFENCDFTVKYKHLANGEIKISGSFDISVPPQESVAVDIKEISVNSDYHNVVIFEYYDNDFLVAAEQIELSRGRLAAPKVSSGKISAHNSEHKVFVDFDKGSMIFDKKSGFIESYIYNSTEFINQSPLADYKGFGLQLYRAPLDNDMNLNALWKKLGLHVLSNTCLSSKVDIKDDRVVIYSVLAAQTPKLIKAACVKAKYTVYANGEIIADYKFSGGFKIKHLPRLGIQLEMPKSFDNVKYYGLGNQVNYPDFREHAYTGVYEARVSEFREDYIKPQESAVRCDVRYAEITNDNGIGLRFAAIEKPFALSVNHYTPQQCAKTMHREDLVDMDTTCINLDCDIMGAGSNSCGPPPSSEYMIGRLKGKELSLFIKPIGD